VISHSIQPYGAAVSRPTSPHYSDQAPLFVRHELKPVWFSTAELKGHIERIYRP
jgi:acyl-homoserine-lactone acylase